MSPGAGGLCAGSPCWSGGPWRRYLALGDSFTEGLNDPDPQRPGQLRGWADRLAEHLAVTSDGGRVDKRPVPLALPKA